MTKPLIIIGGGGHASVLIETLKLLDRELIGIVDPALKVGSTGYGKLPIIGDDQKINSYSPNQVELVNGIGVIPGNDLRKKAYNKYKQEGYIFSSVVHPTAIIANTVELAEGVQIMAGVVIQPNTFIGENSIINTSASIDHNCTVAEHCHVAPHATLCGDVKLGNTIFVGAGATIIQGIEIGKKSVVGAGAVILKNLANNETVRK
ncbi:MAG: acetyltransferase [Gammaproteobacteria bacterium]